MGLRLAYIVKYHPAVKSEDIPKLESNIKERVKKIIETRVVVAPERYGKPLRGTLKGYWKLRVENYRIVFKPEGNEIIILGIRHRKDIYKTANRRKQ